MTITLQEIRLSFIWVETFLDLLSAPATPALPGAFLGNAARYKQVFCALRPAVLTGPLDLALPWRKPRGSRFWARYLGAPVYGDTGGGKAWENLVPFLWRPGVKINADWLAGHRPISPGIYFYPFGSALEITLRLFGPFNPPDAAALAVQARRSGQFEIAWPDDSKQSAGLVAAITTHGLSPFRP